MGCFTAPAAVGVLTALFGKRLPARLHMGWLNAMIWGGAAALAVEHVAHGELVPGPPFLTAMASPAGAAGLLHEIAWVGIPMTLALLAAGAAMVLVYEKMIMTRKTGRDAVAQLRGIYSKYKFGLLALMLAGTAIMVLVDRGMGWLGGAPFWEWTATGMVSSGALLGVQMLLPALLIWMGAVVLQKKEAGRARTSA
ncbi:Uncharacterised protein [uncultured archaeon]|nr:Uncharacterised protein [uncultured archaeon]